MTAEEFTALVGRPPRGKGFGGYPDDDELDAANCQLPAGSCVGNMCGLCDHGYPRVATDRPCPKCNGEVVVVKAGSQPAFPRGCKCCGETEFYPDTGYCGDCHYYCSHCTWRGPGRDPRQAAEPTTKQLIGSEPRLTPSLTLEAAAKYAGLDVDSYRRMLEVDNG